MYEVSIARLIPISSKCHYILLFYEILMCNNMFCIYIMPDSHKFVHYHWIRVYINHARAEIARVEIRYSLFQKQKENHLHQQ